MAFVAMPCRVRVRYGERTSLHTERLRRKHGPARTGTDRHGQARTGTDRHAKAAHAARKRAGSKSISASASRARDPARPGRTAGPPCLHSSVMRPTSPPVRSGRGAQAHQTPTLTLTLTPDPNPVRSGRGAQATSTSHQTLTLRPSPSNPLLTPDINPVRRGRGAQAHQTLTLPSP